MVVGMSLRLSALAAVLSAVLLPAATAAPPAAAATHLVAAGETLSGIAAANGLSPAAVAAANGLSPDAHVIAGTSLEIPAPGTAPAAATAEPAPLGGYRVRLGDTLSAIAAEHGVSVDALAGANGLDPSAPLPVGTSLRLPAEGTTSTGAPATSSTGQRLVNPGETLWSIAMANGITPAALAAANGLDPEAHIIAGTHLTIPAAGSSGVSSAVEGSTALPTGSAPTATGGSLDGATIGQIAASNGAPSSLAQAIAWQESGFNNDMVSVANARGIMQVMPATWDYVQHNLTSTPLDPNSPADNVRAGSLLLGQLLRETGDPATAVAAYYQGLGSVREIGMLPATRQYVANVLALQQRFGG